MTVLRNIEAKIESLFEGVFGRAFRTNVQPVELARKLVKEMEDHRARATRSPCSVSCRSISPRTRGGRST